jgi:deoxyribodipyrimidine photolyase
VEAMPGGNCVVYWMSRDQRVRDNWALLEASRLARASGVALRVVFCLVPRFLDATIRHCLPSLFFCNMLRHDLPPPSGTSGSCAAA